MRRKSGTLVPLEASILEAALRLRSQGVEQTHGFQLAKVMRDGAGARRLTAYGTLYRALERLQDFGFLESQWEDATIASESGRPLRRFYRVTASGERALREHVMAAALSRQSIVQPAT